MAKTLSFKKLDSLREEFLSREYLPITLGERAHGDLGKRIENTISFCWQLEIPGKTDTVYDPTVDPSVLNEFATVAFRSALLISNYLMKFEEKMCNSHSAPLQQFQHICVQN